MSSSITARHSGGSPMPRRRRSADETRQLLLEAGTQLALQALQADDPGQGGPLAHIRVRDVVREASRPQEVPVTTGALYNLWPNQRAFQVDLMFYILREGAFPSAEPILALASEMFAQRLPPELIGERLADESFRIDAASPVARAATAFAALAAVPSVREALRAAHISLLESGRKLYSQLLTYSGLRIREPYTLDQLITVIAALNAGLLTTVTLVPEQFVVPKQTKSLIATASTGIFREFCEPVD
jgi:AcrR family transcriptional regulator